MDSKRCKGSLIKINAMFFSDVFAISVVVLGIKCSINNLKLDGLTENKLNFFLKMLLSKATSLQSKNIKKKLLIGYSKFI